jgi:hypothetical protein
MQDRFSSYACVRHLLLTDPPFPPRLRHRHIVVQLPGVLNPTVTRDVTVLHMVSRFFPGTCKISEEVFDWAISA